MSTMVQYMVIAFAGYVVTVLIVGRLSGKGARGIIIDQRGKYSLSRLQFLLWTSVIAGAYLGIGIAKVATKTGFPFINIPPNVLAVLGFSISGAVGSEVIKSMKIQRARVSTAGEEHEERMRLQDFVDGVAHSFRTGKLPGAWKYVREEFPKAKEAIEREADERPKVVGEFQYRITQLLEMSEMPESQRDQMNTTERKIAEYLGEISATERRRKRIQGLPAPTFLDMFLQEEKEVESVLDIGKFQMFCWTFVALFLYSTYLIGWTSSTSLASIESLPSISTGMLGLMGISQGTYLAMKLPDKPPPSEW